MQSTTVQMVVDSYIVEETGRTSVSDGLIVYCVHCRLYNYDRQFLNHNQINFRNSNNVCMSQQPFLFHAVWVYSGSKVKDLFTTKLVVGISEDLLMYHVMELWSHWPYKLRNRR